MKDPKETWREYVEKVAGKQGLAPECLECFDRYVREHDEVEAAWMALWDWDCCEV